jgi:hypothetical protein
VEPVQVEEEARGSRAVPITKRRKTKVEIRISVSLSIFILVKTGQTDNGE